MSESTPESTPDSGTTVNTGGGDAVVNTAPDGGGVDNAAPAAPAGGESTGGESSDGGE